MIYRLVRDSFMPLRQRWETCPSLSPANVLACPESPITDLGQMDWYKKKKPRSARKIKLFLRLRGDWVSPDALAFLHLLHHISLSCNNKQLFCYIMHFFPLHFILCQSSNQSCRVFWWDQNLWWMQSKPIVFVFKAKKKWCNLIEKAFKCIILFILKDCCIIKPLLMRIRSIHLWEKKIKTHNDNLVIGSSQAANCVDDDDLEGSPGSSRTRLDWDCRHHHLFLWLIQHLHVNSSHCQPRLMTLNLPIRARAGLLSQQAI